MLLNFLPAVRLFITLPPPPSPVTAGRERGEINNSNFYRRRLDTNKPFIFKGVSYLAFRKELSSKSISDFLNNNIVK